MPWHTDRVAIPDTPSYLPSEFVGFSQQMSIFERFQNWLITKSVKLLYRSVELNDNRLLADKFGPGIPDVRDLASQTKLFLVNQHFSYSLPKPLPPNVIEVGGVHISSNKKSLPEVSERLQRKSM